LRQAAVEFIDAGSIASALMGDSIATNMFMLGYAWRKPRTADGSRNLKAIDAERRVGRLQQEAFAWAAPRARPGRGQEAGDAGPSDRAERAPSLADLIAKRVAFLTGYQNAAYAQQYSDFVEQVRAAESKVLDQCQGAAPDRSGRALLLQADGYKDEYEVARLYTTASSATRSPTCSKATTRSTSTSHRATGQARRQGSSDQAAIRSMDDEGLRRAGQAALPARSALDTSATPQNARASRG